MVPSFVKLSSMGNSRAKTTARKGSTDVVLSPKRRECVAPQDTVPALVGMLASLDGTQVREGSSHLGRQMMLPLAWPILWQALMLLFPRLSYGAAGQPSLLIGCWMHPMTYQTLGGRSHCMPSCRWYALSLQHWIARPRAGPERFHALSKMAGQLPSL